MVASATKCFWCVHVLKKWTQICDWLKQYTVNVNKIYVSQLYWFHCSLLVPSPYSNFYLASLQEYLKCPEPSSDLPLCELAYFTLWLSKNTLLERTTPWIPFTNTVEGRIFVWQCLLPPRVRERDEAVNAALISAFLSRSQGTAGSEKPDVSQPIRFSSSFFFLQRKKKKGNCICFLKLVRKETFCLHLVFNSQSYKNTISCFWGNSNS